METLRNRKNTKVKSKKLSLEDRSLTESIEKLHDTEDTDSRIFQADTGDAKPKEKSNYIETINAKIIQTYNEEKRLKKKIFRIKFEIDLISIMLFILGVITRMYRLEEPRNVV